MVSIEHPFDANDDDHCETAPEAYRDVAPILRHIAAWQITSWGCMGTWLRVGVEVKIKQKGHMTCTLA